MLNRAFEQNPIQNPDNNTQKGIIRLVLLTIFSIGVNLLLLKAVFAFSDWSFNCLHNGVSLIEMYQLFQIQTIQLSLDLKYANCLLEIVYLKELWLQNPPQTFILLDSLSSSTFEKNLLYSTGHYLETLLCDLDECNEEINFALQSKNYTQVLHVLREKEILLVYIKNLVAALSSK